MARIFSIEVEFQKRSYTALVSLHGQGNEQSCMVRYLDQELQHLLQGNSIEFSLTDEPGRPVPLPSQLAKRLVGGTREAITAYLKGDNL